MSAKVEVGDEDSLIAALARFNSEVKQFHRRNWIGRRLDHYEKPSDIRRRRAALDKITVRRSALGVGPIKRYVHLREQSGQ